MIRLLPLLLLFLHSPASLQAAPEVSAETKLIEKVQKNYWAFKKITLDLMSKCPPSRCAYVGVGRSPAPIMALLDNFSPGSSTNLPLSLTPATDDGARFVLTKEAKVELYKHFDRFFPGLKDLKASELVLVDYVVTGNSLVDAQKIFAEYALERGYTGKVSVYGFGSGSSVKTVTTASADNGFTAYTFNTWDGEDYKMGRVNDEFMDREYVSLAEYDSYKPEVHDSQALAPRESYGKLRNAMNAKALEDTAPEIVALQPKIASAPLAWTESAPAKKSSKLTALFSRVAKIFCK